VDATLGAGTTYFSANESEMFERKHVRKERERPRVKAKNLLKHFLPL
jgi:hypothetical protein